jgi:hypothetical protein
MRCGALRREMTMDVTHDDNSLWPRLEVQGQQRRDDLLHGRLAIQDLRARASWPRPFFRSSPQSNDLVVVPFYAITRLQVL